MKGTELKHWNKITGWKIIFNCSFLIFNCSIIHSQTWNDVGGGLYQPGGQNIEAMHVFNNALYVTGPFEQAGGINASRVAKWDGVKWDSLGSGIYGVGEAICDYNNKLIVGGSFSYAGNNVPKTNNLAMWDGNNWLSPGNANPNGIIRSLAKYNNELYVGGNYTGIGGVSGINRIAKWDGITWKDVGGGVTLDISQVRCMAVFKGELYVGGAFGKAGGISANFIAKWDGAKWDSLGGGTNEMLSSMVVDTVKNLLYISGGFTKAGGLTVYGVAAWDGNNWIAPGKGIINGPMSMSMYNGDLYVGGQSNWGLPTDTVLARWDGTKWHPILGLNEGVLSLKVYNNELYVGGYFTKINNLTVNGIGRLKMPTSIENIDFSTSLKVYPNPSQNNVTLEYVLKDSSKGVLKIFGIKGELVNEYKLLPSSQKLSLSTSEWPAGPYIFNFEVDGFIVKNEKVVIFR